MKANPLDWVYDLETYPNIFTATFKHPTTGTVCYFEVSEWRNDLAGLIDFLYALKESGCRLVGFNNVGYDYPMLHFIIENYQHGITYADIFTKSDSIINTPWLRRFDNVVWDQDTHIQQIDLYKIHHFDNEARRTSLKMLEFNMRSDNIKDLPFEPGVALTHDQVPTLVKYNLHDVLETEKFYFHSLDLINFREKLSDQYNRNFLNHNDTKIGKDYFIMKLEENIPGSCYMRVDGKRVPRQTLRPCINIGDVIFPYIKLEPEFERVRQWLAAQTIVETKGVFNEVNCTVDGFKYDFGAGGIHGSIDSCTISSDNDFVLFDWDVASYYPNLAIVNNLYPHHLSDEFCRIYKDVYEQRKLHKKGTAENAMLKLALNGVYGDSNNKYSPFYDPQYTMSITINGQLLLCMLAQHLIKLPGLTMVQINTDGLTVRCPRNQVEQMKAVCKWWEDYTQLELESAIYSRMFIRDVNNYIAEYEDGKVKRKGAYAHETPLENVTTLERPWHSNHSALVIPKAAEAALLHGQCIRDFITTHTDINDFMLRTKVGRADDLELSEEINDSAVGITMQQRITRYYIAKQGGTLTKVSPPTKGYKIGQWKRANSLTDQFYNGVIAELKEMMLTGFARLADKDVNGLPWDERINTKNKSKYDTRHTAINAGWLVTPCNDIHDANHENINYEYYIKAAEKLVEPLR
jgi:hypothetical protein